ncbi:MULTISPECIES: hypothetical protein [Proteus]|uniref:hypothetical protein n=1 Tax=Proteus TaxID=583 RepID=UPI000BFDDB87|nr:MULTISPECIES: hypothetical protein [Proteus]ATN00840.1 hypothetical protein CRN77_14365 [Proteus vulgaris]AYY80299.1 hypothetical protein EGX81_05210 [Proteus vulgaris]MBG3092099.1 hypothetical protein [Proteus terrae subsp. cibarius]WCG91864.1 hypothetical protein ONR67_07525 [Proteus terrae]
MSELSVEKDIRLNDELDEWPEFYPSFVPPKKALDADGELFRLVICDPPELACFASTFEEEPRRLKSCKSQEQQECVYGTSFFNSYEGAKNNQDKFPQALGKKKIAKGTLVAKMGKMKQTFKNPAHFTVWLRINSNIHKHFECV